MTSDISPIILEKAPLILAEIHKATSILLHCHPSPDPDSVGSALAMKFALEQLGKKATVIKGDSKIPEAFMHFPGAQEIVNKNFFEVDLKEFDLFIAQDSGSAGMITRLKPLTFPLEIRTIVIDHHDSNPSYADINLIEATYPAVGQILFDLFSLWNVRITPEIAGNLFMGIYADTGGFKYQGTTERTFAIAAALTHAYPGFSELVSDMENSNTPAGIAFQGFALSAVEVFLGGKLAMSAVSNADLISKHIPEDEAGAGFISSKLKGVAEWDVVAAAVEKAPNEVKLSFRSKDSEKYDVSKLAALLGGGGHKAAAGANLSLPLDEAKKLVVAKAKELYNL